MRETVPQVAPFLRIGGREWHLPAALRALQHRNYRLYWLGQLVSLTGTWMQSTAQQWLVFQLTDSPLALGTVMFAGSIPVTLLSLPAGVVVDRVDKRKLITLVQGVMMGLAFALTALVATGAVRYWHVLVLATLLGLANTFDMVARQAFTVEMVGRADLMNAIALNSSIFNGARLVGPAAAGLLIAHVGLAASFALNGLSFMAVIAALVAMRLPPFRPPPGRLRPLAHLREGLDYLRGSPRLLALVAAVGIPSLLGFPYVTLIPVVAARQLGLGPDGFGALISAVGCGALVGALSLAALGNVARKGLLLILARTSFALALLAFALSRSLPLSLAALALAGWGMITHLATTNTLLQLETPDALRGRVMAAYTWLVVGTAPIGALLLGSWAERWGAPSAILFAAATCGASAAASLFVPALRRA